MVPEPPVKLISFVGAGEGPHQLPAAIVKGMPPLMVTVIGDAAACTARYFRPLFLGISAGAAIDSILVLLLTMDIMSCLY
jgi:hypothetical protein